jgi:DNA repair protein RecO (recombination protein O)
MPPIASDALVLRTYKLGETSKVVVLLTRERGKVRAVARGARGARPRYQSALEPLSEVRATLYGRQGAELLRLGDCELVRSAFPAAARGLEESLALSYFAELLDAFCPEGQAEDDVYRLALAVLAAASTVGSSVAVLSRYLEAWLLRLHGIYPPLDQCAGCGAALARGDLRYHATARGFVCGICSVASGPVLSAPTRAFLAELFRRPPGHMPTALPPEAEPLEPFHHDLITQHLEHGLRSHRVLREVAREVR